MGAKEKPLPKKRLPNVYGCCDRLLDEPSSTCVLVHLNASVEDATGSTAAA